jgi:hypothetical protein
VIGVVVGAGGRAGDLCHVGPGSPHHTLLYATCQRGQRLDNLLFVLVSVR